MEDVSFTKIRIAELLKAQVNLMAKSVENLNKPFIEIFCRKILRRAWTITRKCLIKNLEQTVYN